MENVFLFLFRHEKSKSLGNKKIKKLKLIKDYFQEYWPKIS